LIGPQDDKFIIVSSMDCINQTGRDCENGSTTLPYRYYVSGTDFGNDEPDLTTGSGWPSSFAKIEAANPRKKVRLANEGARVYEPTFTDTSDKDVIWMEGGYLHNATSSKRSGWMLPDDKSTTSTVKITESPNSLVPVLFRMFSIARDEEFEDGVETQFSINLNRAVQMAGQMSIEVITDLILTGKVNIEVGAEALRWIGRINDPATYESRQWLLERCLFSRFPRIRDGAALGLSSMDDPHSTKYLRFAVGREEIDELRKDLEQVLQDLEEK
jgi:hypothetical protein